MGTKTQSTVDKIGLKKNSKLNTYNPFLDLTDDQLCELFDSSKKENDTYTFKINTSTGKQTVDKASADIDISIELSIKKLNKINFPNDLDSYTKETAED